MTGVGFAFASLLLWPWPAPGDHTCPCDAEGARSYRAFPLGEALDGDPGASPVAVATNASQVVRARAPVLRSKMSLGFGEPSRTRHILEAKVRGADAQRMHLRLRANTCHRVRRRGLSLHSHLCGNTLPRTLAYCAFARRFLAKPWHDSKVVGGVFGRQRGVGCFHLQREALG